MSLINQMLRDLEQREPALQHGVLPDQVHSTPIKQSSVAIKMLLLGVLALLAFAAGIFSQRRFFPLPHTPSAQDYLTPSQPIAVASIVEDFQGKTRDTVRTMATGVIAVKQNSAMTATINGAVPEAKKEETATSEEGLPSGGIFASENEVAGQSSVSLSPISALTPKSKSENKPNIQQNTSKRKILTHESDQQGSPVVETHKEEGSIDKKPHPATAHERAEAAYRKALVAFKQGQTEEAQKALQAALKEDATYNPARQMLAGFLQQQGNLAEAQTILQQGILLNNAQPQLVTQLARLQVEQNDLQGALTTLRNHVSLGAKNADYRALHAVVLQRLNQHQAAIEEFQAALHIAPTASVWWMGLGFSLEGMGRNTEARQAFEHALASNNLSPELEKFVEQKLR